jgi:hypothetical protein
MRWSFAACCMSWGCAVGVSALIVLTFVDVKYEPGGTWWYVSILMKILGHGSARVRTVVCDKPVLVGWGRGYKSGLFLNNTGN